MAPHNAVPWGTTVPRGIAWCIISVVNKQYKTKQTYLIWTGEIFCHIKYFVIYFFISSFHCTYLFHAVSKVARFVWSCFLFPVHLAWALPSGLLYLTHSICNLFAGVVTTRLYQGNKNHSFMTWGYKYAWGLQKCNWLSASRRKPHFICFGSHKWREIFVRYVMSSFHSSLYIHLHKPFKRSVEFHVHCVVWVYHLSKLGWKGLLTCLTKIPISLWLLNQIGWGFRQNADKL